MPKSRVANKRKYREFSKMKKHFLGPNNFMKNARTKIADLAKKHDITRGQIEFMCWCYDLEFFTKRYAMQEFRISEGKIRDNYLTPLTQKDFLYIHFDRKSISRDTEKRQMFQIQNSTSYRYRYALTQKGRLMVSRYYNLILEDQ